ncbi:NAD(P)-binding protein [Macroventuria anomochaeta]|uniref:NAD(P)-binding protein n=1 Tax=Macroventuria anomochaeta TaxID=301207 RepID=A0ACB6SAX4_9PLEO|nr:NAD(P)-binding protein [Macroventuria anomochaeta]KAF2631366.1 NAD(P)-binding protein [Macroventuria anomochaeta]
MVSQPAFDVKGKTAIVTGAGSGINYCFAKLLLDKGCNVLIADLSLRPEAQRLVEQYSTSTPRAVFQKTDVTNWAELENMFAQATEEFGKIDIVCPGAGIYDPPWSNFWHPPGTSTSRDTRDGGRYATLDINITHPIRTTQLAIAAFLDSQKLDPSKPRAPKRILIVSSIAGQNSNLHTPIYVAAKHAMNGFIRSLSALEPRFNIRVNGVAPGVIKTPLWTEHPEKLQFISTDADEWATPEEVAEAMLTCLVDEDLPGGSILEVGKEQTRLVQALNDPGPSGPGHTVSNLVGKYKEVYGLLEGGDWGRLRGKL